LHHLATRRRERPQRFLVLADDHQVLITDLSTGEILSAHNINPSKGYWRNKQREPGRWLSSPNRDP